MGKRTGMVGWHFDGKIWLVILGAGVIVLATLAAYIPAMHGGFIWDDDLYITENPLLTLPDGLRRIWLSLESPSQYFPLVYTTFRVERALWGLNPFGYHLVNILLHCVNALLVWCLLRRLSIRGAWLAAAIFALHPVHVESVAWITERKNVLSTVFYLLALLAWMKFTDKSATRAWMYYSLTMLLYALALFAKTTACTLPAALLLVLWLKGERIDSNRLRQVAPFVVWGVVMGLVSLWWERYHQGTVGATFALAPMQRILLASRALWFYAGKLAWPAKLTFSYPRWTINPGALGQYAWLVGIVGAAFGLWRWRVSKRGVVTAVVFFAAALAPTLGFVSLYTFRYSFVADHYQYVASIGLIALFAAGITKAWRTPVAEYGMKFALPFAILAALGTLTWRQGHAYKDLETLWRDTLSKNPSSFLAHGGLGAVLASEGQLDEAIDHYYKALRMSPSSVEPHIGLGTAFFEQGRTEEAAERFAKALQINPVHPDAHYNLGLLLTEQGKHQEAIEHYDAALRMKPYWSGAHNNLAAALTRQGKLGEAIEHLAIALQVKPENAAAHLNLGVVLIMQKKFQEAAAHLREALRLQPDSAEAHYNLAILLSQQGEVDEAARHGEEAVRLDPSFAEKLGLRQDPAREHYNLAVRLEDEGRSDEAIREYREAIRVNPDFGEAHANLGRLLVHQGRIDEGIREYRNAIRVRPDLAEAHNNLAIALYLQGKYAEAWKEVRLCRKCGVEPHPSFIQALSEKVPEPVE